MFRGVFDLSQKFASLDGMTMLNLLPAGCGILTQINASYTPALHFAASWSIFDGVKAMAKDLRIETEGRRDVGDPIFRPLGLLRDDIDVAFDRLFGNLPFRSRAFEADPFRTSLLGDNGAAAQPRVDVSEDEDKFEIAAEVPGVDEKDITLTIKDDLLTLKGEKKSERKEEKKNYYMKERSYGSFLRSFRLPDTVKAEKVRAKFANGVVTIELPKDPKAAAKEKRIPIQSK